MAPCVSNLSRMLLLSTDHRISLLFNFTSLSRRGYVASSKDSGSGGEGAKESTPSMGSVGQVDKQAERRRNSRPKLAWVPDPQTGYYRLIDEASEAQENALKRNK